MARALLGLVPALQSTRPDVAGALRGENAGGGQPGQLRWRNVLVVTQLTISLVLLVGAGLFLRSHQRVQSVDPGFGREPTNPDTCLSSSAIIPPPSGYSTWLDQLWAVMISHGRRPAPDLTSRTRQQDMS